MFNQFGYDSSESPLWDVVAEIEEFIQDHKGREVETRIRYKKAKRLEAEGLGAVGISLKAGSDRFEYVGPAYPHEADMVEAMIGNLLEETA